MKTDENAAQSGERKKKTLQKFKECESCEEFGQSYVRLNYSRHAHETRRDEARRWRWR